MLNMTDWDKEPDWVNFKARDEDGEVFRFAEEPRILGCIWVEKAEASRSESVGYEPNNKIDWTDSLETRPTTENEMTDWDKEPDWVNFKARDEDGDLYRYSEKPSKDWTYNHWLVYSDGRSESLGCQLDDGSDWTDSLETRPTTENEMSRPPFRMSKYANELDLHNDAHVYYKDKVVDLEGHILKAFFSGTIEEAREHLIASGCIPACG